MEAITARRRKAGTLVPVKRVDQAHRPKVTSFPSYKVHPTWTLVLDLDQTLIYTYDHNEAQYDALDPTRRYQVEGHVGVLRPYCREFCDFAFKHFRHVVVWTAGTKDYAEAIGKVLFGDNHQVPIFHRSHCQSTPDDGVFTKPLHLIAKSLRIPLRSIVLLDDRHDNGYYNPDHLLLITPYQGQANDHVLVEIAQRLANPWVHRSDCVRHVIRLLNQPNQRTSK